MSKYATIENLTRTDRPSTFQAAVAASAQARVGAAGRTEIAISPTLTGEVGKQCCHHSCKHTANLDPYPDLTGPAVWHAEIHCFAWVLLPATIRDEQSEIMYIHNVV